MKKKVITIVVLILIAIILIIGIILKQKIESQEDINIFEKDIILPDRIVYKNQEGLYFEFIKDSDEYNKITDLLKNSIKEYNSNGITKTDSEIEEIKSNAFIEFDYKTVSKNYLIPLYKIENVAIIKFEETGGKVCTEKISNLNKINKELEELSKDKKSYKLEYKEMISRNTLDTVEYKYLQEMKEINYKIHQVKITDMQKYDLYKEMFNLSFDESITEDTFNNNILILTVTLEPKIEVKVNVGNIKYSYNKLENFNYKYTCHLLKVSKIVNCDCIYNTDLSEIANNVSNDNMKIEYDKQVEQLNSDIFVKDFDSFIQEYNKSSNRISLDSATKIAEKAFKEAERVVGKYDEKTQKVTETVERPNNFFTRKTEERDWNSNTLVDVYCFTRNDSDNLNGINIYIDKRLGKVIGASAFGD